MWQRIEMGKGQNWLVAAAAAVQMEVWKYRDRTLTFPISVEKLQSFLVLYWHQKNMKPQKCSELKTHLGGAGKMV